MAFQHMAFTPPTGLRDTATYPTQPESEQQIRAAVQSPSDQIRDYINETLLTELKSTTTGASGADTIGSAPLTENSGTTVRDQIVWMKSQVDAAAAANLTEGVVISDYLALNAVTATKIADNAVSTRTIIDGAVTQQKIADDAITLAMMTDASVGTAELINGSVTAAKLAGNSVAETSIMSNAVTRTKIMDREVVTDKIADGAVTNSKLSDESVTNNKIANLAINNDTNMGCADGNISLSTQIGPRLTSYGSGVNAKAAGLTFNRVNAYAVNFGLDTDNQLKVGGYEMGANAYKIWHEGNLDPYINCKDIGSSTSYTNVHQEFRCGDGGNVSIGFHRSGVSAVSLVHNGNGLYLYNSGYSGGGAVMYAGAFTTFSSREMKEDIKPLRYGLQDILKINAYSFFYKKNKPDLVENTMPYYNNADSSLKIGTIAEELIDIIPEAVSGDFNDPKSIGVDYGALTMPIINAIKELFEKIKYQEEQIAFLKKDHIVL